MATTVTTAHGTRRSVSEAINYRMANVRRGWQRHQEQARIRAELSTMTTRELADLGLVPSDIDDVAAGRYSRG